MIETVEQARNLPLGDIHSDYYAILSQFLSSSRVKSTLEARNSGNGRPLNEYEQQKLCRLSESAQALANIVNIIEERMTQLTENKADRFEHISKRHYICDYCGATVVGPVFFRYHGEKCKNKKPFVAPETTQDPIRPSTDCIV